MVSFQQAASFARILRLQHFALPPSLVLQTDRETYITTLRSQTSQAGAWIVLALSSEDVDFQVCFLESIISKGMHRSLARNRWRLPPCKTISDRGSEERSKNDRRLSWADQEYTAIFCISDMLVVLALFLQK